MLGSYFLIAVGFLTGTICFESQKELLGVVPPIYDLPPPFPLQNVSEELPKLEGEIFVHMIPHTHDDVGWLKTVDEYFSGTHMSSVQLAGVEMILDGAIQELLNDPHRKFSYVEMKFFSMWWYEQTEELKDQVRQLVQEGRLEIINGGWSMHDEACPHYQDFLHNMQLGHKFITEELGVAPRVGWQIDPFGHSNTNARLFAEMGFDAQFFARIDFQDKERRLNESEMEFIWRPSFESQGTRGQIFSHTLYQHYSAPNGYSFDITHWGVEVYVNDPELETYNKEEKLDGFMRWVLEQSKHYKTNHLFITMGDDFNYMNAKMYFKAMDAMIDDFNAKYDGVTLIYSTPSDYLDAIFALDVEWPTKYDDLFPYADNSEAYWTGYFTSRSNLKEYIRRISRHLTASHNLYALKVIDQEVQQPQIDDILSASLSIFDAVGITQHHDAATGTSKQHVADDYGHRLFIGLEANTPQYAQVVADLALKEAALGSGIGVEWTQCFRENATYLACPVDDQGVDQPFYVAVHNPSSIPLTTARISLPQGQYSVQKFDQAQGSFASVASITLCDSVRLDGHPRIIQEEPVEIITVENCEVFAEVQLEANEVGYLMVQKATNEANEDKKSLEEFQIESEKEKEGNGRNLFSIGNFQIKEILPANPSEPTLSWNDIGDTLLKEYHNQDWQNLKGIPKSLEEIPKSLEDIPKNIDNDLRDKLREKQNEMERPQDPIILSAEEVVQIENDFESITYIGSDNDNGLVFQVEKKGYNKTLQFAFDLRYWDSETVGQNSGVYIFRPYAKEENSQRYVSLSGIKSESGELVSSITLDLTNVNTGAEAQVFIKLFKDQPFSEWLISLGGVPRTTRGMEVTVNFYSYEIQNKDTFYTDSNGLEMQKRVLNYRPTWHFENQDTTVTFNYYPVSTGIALKDEESRVQMTLMNSRSQGGSAVVNGRLELMQQRRIYRDDGRGMGEPLDETNHLEDPIWVPALYYLQLFDFDQEPSLQRHIQHLQDDPPQYFFYFPGDQMEVKQVEGKKEMLKMDLESYLINADEQDSFKISLFPVARNIIQARIANLGDLFDSEGSSVAPPMSVDLLSLARDIFSRANGDSSSLQEVLISEKSFTGNQDYEDMWSKKLQWRTVDDSSVEKTPKLKESFDSLELEKQRIRVFELEFVLQ